MHQEQTDFGLVAPIQPGVDLAGSGLDRLSPPGGGLASGAFLGDCAQATRLIDIKRRGALGLQLQDSKTPVQLDLAGQRLLLGGAGAVNLQSMAMAVQRIVVRIGGCPRPCRPNGRRCLGRRLGRRLGHCLGPGAAARAKAQNSDREQHKRAHIKKVGLAACQGKRSRSAPRPAS